MIRPVTCPSCEGARVTITAGAGVCPACRRAVLLMDGVLWWVVPGPGASATSCALAGCGQQIPAGVPRLATGPGRPGCLDHVPAATLQQARAAGWDG